MMLIPKNKPIVSEKIRKSARGQDCTVRLPGVCNFDPTTTILAHLRMAGITGERLKAHDIHGAYCCSACHDHIDGRVERVFEIDYLRLAFHDGLVRTQNILIQMGLIKVF